MTIRNCCVKIPKISFYVKRDKGIFNKLICRGQDHWQPYNPCYRSNQWEKYSKWYDSWKPIEHTDKDEQNEILAPWHVVAKNLIEMFPGIIFLVRGNNIEANDLIQFGSRYNILFYYLNIILVRIINRSIIADIKQGCSYEWNSTNSMLKHLITFLFFVKVLLHLIQLASIVCIAMLGQVRIDLLHILIFT